MPVELREKKRIPISVGTHSLELAHDLTIRPNLSGPFAFFNLPNALFSPLGFYCCTPSAISSTPSLEFWFVWPPPAEIEEQQIGHRFLVHRVAVLLHHLGQLRTPRAC